MNYPKAPKRGALPSKIEKAVRAIHRDVWGTPYRPGEGPMHYAGGAYWRRALLRHADRWERLAAAARVAATFLPDDDEAVRRHDAVSTAPEATARNQEEKADA